VHSAAAAEKTAAATAVLYMAAALHTAAAEMAAAEMAADSEEYHNSFHSNAPHTRKKSACHYVVTCLLQAPYGGIKSISFNINTFVCNFITSARTCTSPPSFCTPTVPF
jgi:hypothetical protein